MVWSAANGCCAGKFGGPGAQTFGAAPSQQIFTGGVRPYNAVTGLGAAAGRRLSAATPALSTQSGSQVPPLMTLLDTAAQNVPQGSALDFWKEAATGTPGNENSPVPALHRARIEGELRRREAAGATLPRLLTSNPWDAALTLSGFFSAGPHHAFAGAVTANTLLNHNMKKHTEVCNAVQEMILRRDSALNHNLQYLRQWSHFDAEQVYKGWVPGQFLYLLSVPPEVWKTLAPVDHDGVLFQLPRAQLSLAQLFARKLAGALGTPDGAAAPAVQDFALAVVSHRLRTASLGKALLALTRVAGSSFRMEVEDLKAPGGLSCLGSTFAVARVVVTEISTLYALMHPHDAACVTDLFDQILTAIQYIPSPEYAERLGAGLTILFKEMEDLSMLGLKGLAISGDLQFATWEWRAPAASPLPGFTSETKKVVAKFVRAASACEAQLMIKGEDDRPAGLPAAGTLTYREAWAATRGVAAARSTGEPAGSPTATTPAKVARQWTAAGLNSVTRSEVKDWSALGTRLAEFGVDSKKVCLNGRLFAAPCTFPECTRKDTHSTASMMGDAARQSAFEAARVEPR